jgi:hypothetical protein
MRKEKRKKIKMREGRRNEEGRRKAPEEGRR